MDLLNMTIITQNYEFYEKNKGKFDISRVLKFGDLFNG